MTTIKAYTDLEQSKKLAEILSIESADGYWFKGFPAQPYIVYTKGTPNPGEHIPCWSLAALLSVLPDHFYDETGKNKFGMDKGNYRYYVFYETQNSYIQTSADNPVDACVDMIIKLHELKKL